VDTGVCRTTGPEPVGADAATLLSVARVTKWTSHRIGAGAAGQSLESLIERTSRSAGIDTGKPFPFLIETDAATLELHVVNGFCPHGADPGSVDAEPWRWSGEHAGRTTIVGIFARDAAGVLTHHATAVHAHAILTLDGRVVTGHIDTLRVPAGAILRLPAAS
jgi:hypothetical protein